MSELNPGSFALEEYKALRAEILERSRQDQNLQRNCFIATGAIYAFSFTQFGNPAASFALFVAPFLFFVVLLQTRRHKAYGRRIGQYIRNIENFAYQKIEKELTVPAGWENFLYQIRADEQNTDTQILNEYDLKNDQEAEKMTYLDIMSDSLFSKSHLNTRTRTDNLLFSWACVLSLGIAVIALIYSFTLSKGAP